MTRKSNLRTKSWSGGVAAKAQGDAQHIAASNRSAEYSDLKIALF